MNEENNNISFYEDLDIPNISQENYNKITFDSNAINENLNLKAIKRGELKKQKEELESKLAEFKVMKDAEDMNACLMAATNFLKVEEERGKKIDPDEREIMIMSKALEFLHSGYQKQSVYPIKKDIEELDSHIRSGRK